MTIEQAGKRLEVSLAGKTTEEFLLLEENIHGTKFYSWENEENGTYFRIRDNSLMRGSIKGLAFTEALKITPMPESLSADLEIGGKWTYAQTSMTGRYFGKGEMNIVRQGSRITVRMGSSENSEEFLGKAIMIGKSRCLRLSSGRREMFLYLTDDGKAMAGYVYYSEDEVEKSAHARYIMYAFRP